MVLKSSGHKALMGMRNTIPTLSFKRAEILLECSVQISRDVYWNSRVKRTWKELNQCHSHPWFIHFIYSQYSSPANRAEKIHFCAEAVWVFDGIPVEVISHENYNWFQSHTNYRGNKARMLGRFPPIENRSVWTSDVNIHCVQRQFLTS